MVTWGTPRFAVTERIKRRYRSSSRHAFFARLCIWDRGRPYQAGQNPADTWMYLPVIFFAGILRTYLADLTWRFGTLSTVLAVYRVDSATALLILFVIFDNPTPVVDHLRPYPLESDPSWTCCSEEHNAANLGVQDFSPQKSLQF